MKSFHPGDLGWAVGRMHGGPFDGKAYGDLPIFPGGLPAESMGLPISQLGDAWLRANYTRRGDEPREGAWHYDYVDRSVDGVDGWVEEDLGYVQTCGGMFPSPEPE